MPVLESLNVVAQCRRYRVGLWRCPQFLFIVVGFIIIISMITTFVVAKRYDVDPAMVVIFVSSIAAVFFTIGQIIVTSFERISDASRAQTEFISIISHQLRTPLSAVKWQVGLMKEKLRKGKSDISGIITAIEEENEQVIKLVSSLLEVNRIEEKRTRVQKSKVSLWRVTEKMMGNYKSAAASLNMELTLEKSGNSSYDVFADEIKLQWVIENLIDNALRYNRPGGHIRIRLLPWKGKARWEIQDGGIGIPREERKKIFQKFYRAENALKAKPDGSGLGLFIVKSFIEIMNGKVDFISEENKGSTFWFALPATAGNAEESSA